MKKSKILLAATVGGALGAGSALAGNGHGQGKGLAAAPGQGVGGNAGGNAGGNGNGGTHTGAARGRPGRGSAPMVAGAADDNASGKVDLRFFPAVGKRAERSWLRMKMRHLEPNAAFSIWADDPSTIGDALLVQVGTDPVMSNDEGAINLRIDTKLGGALPFGATLASLAGLSFEIRDAAGGVVLSGTFPALE